MAIHMHQSIYIVSIQDTAGHGPHYKYIQSWHRWRGPHLHARGRESHGQSTFPVQVTITTDHHFVLFGAGDKEQSYVTWP